jgi:hypothetical protein
MLSSTRIRLLQVAASCVRVLNDAADSLRSLHPLLTRTTLLYIDHHHHVDRGMLTLDKIALLLALYAAGGVALTMMMIGAGRKRLAPASALIEEIGPRGCAGGGPQCFVLEEDLLHTRAASATLGGPALPQCFWDAMRTRVTTGAVTRSISGGGDTITITGASAHHHHQHQHYQQSWWVELDAGDDASGSEDSWCQVSAAAEQASRRADSAPSSSRVAVSFAEKEDA